MVVMPVVLTKSTERGRFDFVHPYLREIWTGIIGLYLLGLCWWQRGYLMEQRTGYRTLWSYAIVAFIGATSACIVWWLTGFILDKAEAKPSPTPPLQIAISKLPAQYETGPGPVPPPSDSVSTVVTPSDPKYGAMTGGFSTSGNGEYEVDILKVAPEKLEFDPPGISIKREQLPVDLKIDEHRTVTVKNFTNRGFVIDDHRWPGVAMNVTLLHTLPSPEEKKMNPESDKVAPNSKIVQKGKNNIAQIGNNNQATINVDTSRRLTPPQIGAIKSSAQGICKILPLINITASIGNQEAQRYATDFVGALRGAGCNADLALPIPGLTPDITGIHIGVRNYQNIGAAAKSLGEVLSSAGLYFSFAPLKPDFFPDEEFVLIIGAKE
jgi:hypothetical protein